MSDLSDLRCVVLDLAQGQCEHPVGFYDISGIRLGEVRCPGLAVELAHVKPRGMGHNGYRNTPAHVIAACLLHARTTDNLSASAWLSDVPSPHDRRALLEWVRGDRCRRGYTMLAEWDTEWSIEYERI